MASKLPWVKFHFRDWIVDTQTLTPDEKGCWMDILCQMWVNGASEVLMDYDELAQLWHIKTPEETKEIIGTLQRKGICDIEVQDDNVRFHKGRVRIICRRLVKEETDRELNAKYQKSHREKTHTSNLSGKNKPLESEVRSQKSEKDNGSPPSPPGGTAGVTDLEFMKPIGQTAISAVPNLVQQFLSASRPQLVKKKQTIIVAEPVRKILLCFKVMQGFKIDDAQWDKVYFKRLVDNADDLLDVFSGDYKMAVQCMAELAGTFSDKGLTWTLNTIVNHAAEWRYKNAQPVNP